MVLTYNKRVLVSDSSNAPLKYSFKIYIDQVDKVLSKQRFNYSTNINKKYISVITLDKTDANVQEYIIHKDASTDITIPKNMNFIISFPANSTVAYTWAVKNNINTGVLNFIKKTRIIVPMPLFKPRTTGESYDRENLYFKSIKEGNDKLVLRYEHNGDQNPEFFETTLNITVK